MPRKPKTILRDDPEQSKLFIGRWKETPETRPRYEPAASIAGLLEHEADERDDVQTGQSARGLAFELAAED